MNNIDERRGATSASNAQADLLCPGRHLAQAQAGLPDKDTKDAAHGRLVHAALAGDAEALGSLNVEQKDLFDTIQKIEEREVKKAFGEAWQQAKVWKEERFWVRFAAEINGERRVLEHSAKPDKVYRLGPRALIIEYKTLSGDVPESPTNQQGRDQVSLVSGELLVYQIGFMIIQPYVTHEPEMCIYEKDDIERAKQEMFRRVAMSNTPGSPRVAGEKQCTFCRAKGDCDAYNRWAGSNLPQMQVLLEVPVSRWSPEQRAMFCSRMSIAQGWLDTCKDQIKLLMKEDPNAVPGYTLRPGNVVETVTDPGQVYARFSQLGGTQDQFMTAVSIGKTKLKEAMAEATGLKGKSLQSAIEKLLDGCVSRNQNSPSIAKVEGAES